MKNLKALIEKVNQKYIYTLVVLFAPFAAQANDGSRVFDDGLGTVIGLIVKLSFVICIGFGCVAGYKFIKGENEQGKTMLIGVFVTASVFVICKIAFSSMGLGDAVIDTKFN